MSKNILKNSRGFTLVASLLMLVMLSGISIGLLFLVSGRGRSSGNDMESNVAYYGAESGMEKLTADLAALYQAFPAPTPSQLTALANNPPDSTQMSDMTYVEGVTFQVDAKGNPVTKSSVISQGPNQGLIAEIIPLTLQVNAIRPSGANANITRGVEVALIPVFQFGVFSDSDLSYYAGPQFGFQGRVHTNGNLFLAANSGPLILDGKVTAVKEIVRDTLANNFSNGSSYTGSVFVPNVAGGCDTYLAGGAQGSNCLDFGSDSNRSSNDASWSGGAPPVAGASNSSWVTSSKGRFGGMIGNAASTGVATLQLPFVQGNASQQVQIIRKPTTTNESPSSPIGSSREYNKANIRVLLGDNEAELHPNGTPNDAFDVQLETLAGITVTNTGGVLSYFAVADPASSGNDPNLIAPRCKPNGNAAAPYPQPAGTCTAWAPATWPLVRGWLRVEYLNNAGNYVGVTQEWLKYGFAKFSETTRTAPGVDVNGHKDAILIFQQVADRNGDTAIVPGTTKLVSVKNSGGTTTNNVVENGNVTGQNWNFYPINFFDPREGYPRNTITGLASPQCYANGIMNSVELDVGNLNLWLQGTGDYAGSKGPNVNYTIQNGYLLYYSDRRGMEPDPNSAPAAGVTYGVSGLEDVINSASATGMPDGVKDPVYSNPPYSAEDVDENTKLDNWGGVNIGDGFGVNTNTAPPNPFAVVNCNCGGRQNWVSGARHVLRLVDGGLGNLPIRPDTLSGGFTVAAENPVYVWGNYNSTASPTDPFWGNPNAADIQHAAAAIIADSVTLLSNNYTDLLDMQNTLSDASRLATNTYYRMAISAGKNMNFQNITTTQDFGEDGGLHNFLRYIENWSGFTLGYRGSLVSLYYSQYSTGTYKSSGAVYSPPVRAYFFDTQFLTPTNLPPGTPMLQDVVNLTYWQNYQAY
jgi:PilX N-terminal